MKSPDGTALNSQKEKMMISAKVICDSISPSEVRIVTMELEYPRIIHSEFMTHRVFSRNAASSRAIPVPKMLERVRLSTAMPVSWGKNQAGMQAGEEHSEAVVLPDFAGGKRVTPCDAWASAARSAAAYSEAFSKAGYHKQVANRLTEPFQWMRTLVTSTEWDNFFELRDHEAADPTFQALAAEMNTAQKESVPVLRTCHLPYVTNDEQEIYKLDVLFKLSANRCKRVSYFNFGGAEVPVAEELAGFYEMANGVPLHASPLEHPAMAMAADEYSGNFHGWHQFRQAWEGRKPYRKAYASDAPFGRRNLMLGDQK